MGIVYNTVRTTVYHMYVPIQYTYVIFKPQRGINLFPGRVLLSY